MNDRKRKTYSKKMLNTISIYAAIALVIIIAGIVVLWNYMDAYEASQPENVMDAYMQTLDAKHVLNHSQDLIESVNPEVQREAECRQIITDVIKDGIQYERKLSECSDTKKVYMLTSGENTVGKVVLTAQGKGSFGLPNWEISESTFDFSFLLNEGVKVNVPQHYKVYANGKQIGSKCILQQDTPIEVLKDFYADYDTLPYMVTYQVGPCLGDVEITITNAEDKPVTQEQATDEAFILDNCSNAEKDTLDTLVTGYIESYVRFSSNAGGTLNENYENILTYIVPESELAQRIEDALGGLKWVKNQNAEVLSKTIHHRTRLAGGLYLYDISYDVAITYQGGTTTTTENVRFILSQTTEGLKVEKMLNY